MMKIISPSSGLMAGDKAHVWCLALYISLCGSLNAVAQDSVETQSPTAETAVEAGPQSPTEETAVEAAPQSPTSETAVEAGPAADDDAYSPPAPPPPPLDPIASASAARDRALDANAPRYAEKQWKKAGKAWDRALNYRDRGDADKAIEAAGEAQELFAAAELAALQVRIPQGARDAIEEAVRNKASRYAPRTLERSRKLVTKAENALAADRSDTDGAAAIAAEAAATARHAGQIAAIAADKPSAEELLLRWDSYLGRLQAAADMPTAADADTEFEVAELEAEIERMRLSENRLQRELGNSQAFNAALEDEIRELDERLGGASSEREQLIRRLEEQARTREQFAQAESLFSPDEAIVLRQSDEIVARLIGLRFASGSPKLDTGNTKLLKKIGEVIAIYPRSLLEVEGHTDSRGSDRINKRLSEQRAQEIANYLIGDMGIPAHRITVVGYGSDKPIANNETQAGREKNRRIDLRITPEQGARF